MEFQCPRNKKNCLTFSLVWRPEYDWGIGAVLRLIRFDFTFYLILGCISVYWRTMTDEEAIELIKGGNQ